MKLYLGKNRFTLFGGPYTEKPKGMFGVKMAAEINKPCDINIPTPDFHVPDTNILLNGMARTVIALHKKKEVYIGCMAGRGRTGLFMAAMVQLSAQYRHKKLGAALSKDIIPRVRREYYSHAVETKGQENFITRLETTRLHNLVWALDTIPFFSKLPESWILKLTIK
jgi:hypothetical protein